MASQLYSHDILLMAAFHIEIELDRVELFFSIQWYMDNSTAISHYRYYPILSQHMGDERVEIPYLCIWTNFMIVIYNNLQISELSNNYSTLH